MDVLSLKKEQYHSRLNAHVSKVYGEENSEYITEKIMNVFGDIQPCEKEVTDIDPKLHWDETDVCLITYGNSILSSKEAPLQVLYKFLIRHLKGVIKSVHILPFFPYSSDDGFAVIDYKKVNDELGNWKDITRISNQFKLMADLVINHISSKSKWFQQFIKGEEPGVNYFFEVKEDDDISEVIRPRSSPLLQTVETSRGKKFVWCTFSFDQVDLDFSNPDVLIEVLKILRFYLENGVQIIRLDAIAFIWKVIGTPCINLNETHEIIKILRLVVERYFSNVVFVTETNVPNLENLKYFGNTNEAHIIYSFSLPPLLLHALWKGESEYLTNWSMSLPPAPYGCTYLNFTASHDGIGLRPAEGIISDIEIDQLISAMKSYGGEITTRAINDVGERPYEINITWFEAMKGTSAGVDEYQIERFLCSQIIMLGLEGIPAFYLNSLLASENDLQKFAETNHKRSINRKQWNHDELEDRISDMTSKTCKVFYELKRLISIRTKQKAFHPNATQYTLQLGSSVFGYWRQSIHRGQSIFAIHNLTAEVVKMPIANINLICTDNWNDLIAWEPLDLSQDSLSLKPYQCLWITNNF